MTWTQTLQGVCKKQCQPMHQATYWALFLATGLTYALKTVE